MWIFLGIITLLIMLLFVLFISTISIQLQYSHVQDSDCLKIRALIWRKIPVYKMEVPVIKVDEDQAAITLQTKSDTAVTNEDKKIAITPPKLEERVNKFKDLLSKISGFYQIINQFLRKVHVSNFRWHSNIGLGDAALTGVVTGCAWGVKGGVVGLIGNKMVFDNEPQISINPLFQMSYSETNLSCMISFKIGNAILVALRLAKHWKGRN